jgi:hypothetical protein
MGAIRQHMHATTFVFWTCCGSELPKPCDRFREGA